LIGFMLGSLPRIWPWRHAVEFSIRRGEPTPVRFALEWPPLDWSTVGIVAAALLGLALVLAVECGSRRRGQQE